MYGIFFASILDLLIGDPYNFPHPVKIMGNIISFEEKLIRRFSHTKRALQFSGLMMTLINIAFGFFFPFLLLHFTSGILKIVLSIYIIYTSISGKMLAYEANKVKEALCLGLNEARERLKYIVGRDTSVLSESEIISATIETVAENTSDGIIAPLFYISIFGPAGGWMYKFVNTMDSMVGYRNDKYEDLGKASALIDDVFNYIPARITGFLMIFYGLFNGRFMEAISALKKDHGNHLSPNAGYPESSMAGLLGIQLGGGHYYFGKFVDKPTIGENTRKNNIDDISTSIKIMYFTMFLWVIVSAVLYQFIHM